MTHLRLVRAAPTGVNERWSTDLVTDGLFNGRRFRALTIVPKFAGRALDAWAHHQGVRHQLIVPGRPVQNAFRVLTDSCEKNA